MLKPVSDQQFENFTSLLAMTFSEEAFMLETETRPDRIRIFLHPRKGKRRLIVEEKGSDMALVKAAVIDHIFQLGIDQCEEEVQLMGLTWDDDRRPEIIAKDNI